ncbi:MAG: CBS domain-containing protein [Gammaproteobacteria bacterium]|nr:CBS domain-containing protein [Gammaproteobacteria bacterium]
MLEGVLEVSETRVRDTMIPRSQMVMVESDAPVDDVLKVIVDSGHSRFPVLNDDREEVIGILLAKDLLKFFAEQGNNGQAALGARFTMSDTLRPAVFVPESKRLNVLLREFRASRNHMAIVVDEYGGVAGLITIEDVIEHIVGDIDDEHDVENDVLIQKEADGSYTVQAITRIEEFNEELGCYLSDQEYDTIGGLVMHQLGRVPRRNDKLSFEGFEFKVLRADRRKVDSLSITKQTS